MRWMDVLRLRWRSLTGRERLEDRLDEELRFHLDESIAAKRAEGLNEADARAAALREFGAVEALKEECRDTRGVSGLENLWRDLRFGLRAAWANPTFTLTIVCSLAFGLGGAVSIFSIVESVLLRPLPVRNPQELKTFDVTVESVKVGPSYKDLQIFAKQQDVLAGYYASGGRLHVRLTTGGRTIDAVPANQVTYGFFDVLGLRPAAGRFFLEEEDRVAGSALESGSVAVISHDFWLREFGGNAGTVGSMIEVNRVKCQVIGVAPEGFQGDAYGQRVDVWVPALPFQEKGRELFGSRMVRLRPGVTVAQAEAQLTSLVQQLQSTRPKNDLLVRREDAEGWRPLDTSPRNYRAQLGPGDVGFDVLRSRYERPLLLMLGATLLVFLAGCANAATLMLSRGVARRQEFSIRAALGASRSRLVMQVTTECVALAVMASLAGLLLGRVFSRVLVSLVDVGQSPGLTIENGWRLGLFLAALASGAILLFGLVPAWNQTRGLSSMGGRSVTGKGRRMHDAMVVLQVLLSVLLLAAAIQLGESIRNLRRQDFGFEPRRAMAATYWLNARDASLEHARDVSRRLLERVSGLPGVDSASISVAGFFSGRDLYRSIAIPGDTRTGLGARLDFVSPRYFEVMGIPLLAGRAFRDVEDTSVALVNEAAVNKLFKGVNPVGAVVQCGSQPNVRIVGVVRNARYRNARIDYEPSIFLHYREASRAPARVEVRTAADATAMGAALRAALRDTDPDVVIESITTLTGDIDKSFQREILLAKLVGTFAVLALLLACGGLYGLMSYSVSRRANEFGIRMALGAQPREVLALVLRDSGRLVLIGILLGIPAALAATRLLQSFLFGVRSDEPWTYVVVTLSLGAAGLAAAFLPARSAARVDPASVLRLE